MCCVLRASGPPCCLLARAFASVVREHGVSAPVLHLLLRAAHGRLEVPAAGHGALRLLALPRVQMEQRPHALARLAAAGDAHLAVDAVVEEHLHLVAVGRRAVAVTAGARVHEQLHGALHVRQHALAALALLFAAALGRSNHRVRVFALRVAAGAQVEVRALGAPEAVARLYLRRADVAARRKRRHVGVVKMVERHHARVLGSAQLVELVVVALAQRQVLLPRVEELGRHRLVRLRLRRVALGHGRGHSRARAIRLPHSAVVGVTLLGQERALPLVTLRAQRDLFFLGGLRDVHRPARLVAPAAVAQWRQVHQDEVLLH
mmetsp:Transcript_2021/g.8044  ORF Transcript_2021/g.8044 Transcript_2021/m.8044 type:complete len:319 (+) Transcript_2021:2550-3506(+)